MAKQDPTRASPRTLEAGDLGREDSRATLAERASRLGQAADYARDNPKSAIAAGAALAAGAIAAAAIPLVRGRSGAGGAKKAGGVKKATVLNVRDGNGPSAKVKFGSVTVRGVKPAAATVATNVKRSTDALERVTKTLAKPGVVIRSKKDVPQFSAAESERGVFIRRLNGRVERGRLVNGTFKVID